MKSPTKRPSEKGPRECLQTACTAVSSSITVSQKRFFPIFRRVCEFSDFETTGPVGQNLNAPAPATQNSKIS